MTPTERRLEEEIAKRDRIIRAFMSKDRAPRRGRAPDPMQAALNVSRFPLTEFGMSPEGKRIDLPQTLDEIAEVIGREGALKLAEGLLRQRTGSRPRRQLYVPSRAMAPDHPLVAILGRPLAEALQERFANCIVEVPKMGELQLAYRRHVARQMLAAGEAEEDIVACGVLSREALDDLRGAAS